MKDLIRKYPRLSIIITIVLAIIVLAITAQAGGPVRLVNVFAVVIVILVTNIAKETLPISKRMAKIPAKFRILILGASIVLMFSSLYYRIQLLLAASIATVIDSDADIDVVNLVCFIIGIIPLTIFLIKTKNTEDVKTLKIRFTAVCFFITYILGGPFVTTVMFDLVSPFSKSDGELGFYTNEKGAYSDKPSWNNMFGFKYRALEHAELSDTVFYSKDSTVCMVYSLNKDKREGWLETVSGDFNSCNLKMTCKYKYLDSQDAKTKESESLFNIYVTISELDEKDVAEYKRKQEMERIQDSINTHGDMETLIKHITDKRIRSAMARDKDIYKVINGKTYKISLETYGCSINDITDPRISDISDGLRATGR